MPSELNQISRTTLIRAPRARVWRALTDPAEFGHWFHCETTAAEFAPGARISAKSTYPGKHYGVEFTFEIADVVHQQTFSWHWHPNAVTSEDLSAEPMTLVTFHLEDADGGTRVTITESGFDHIFAHRRQSAFESNEGGWKIQIANLAAYAADAS